MQEGQLKAIVESTWPACTEADPERPARPFRATAIIANPPCGSYMACAEKLQVWRAASVTTLPHVHACASPLS